MPDRESIIKGWEEVLSRDPLDVTWDLIDNTLTLLKEQEPVAVKESEISRCSCKNTVNRYWHPNFCGYCGKELFWY